MQLVCPSCAATYLVPDAMIGAGRSMRCARCGHDWFAAPSAPAPAPASAPDEAATPAQLAPEPAVAAEPRSRPSPPPVAAQRLAPVDVVAVEQGRESGKLLLALAWIASIAVLAVGGYFFWTRRGPLAEFWPPLSRLYALLGG